MGTACIDDGPPSGADAEVAPDASTEADTGPGADAIVVGDTGTPPADSGVPPVDSGVPPVDSGVPVGQDASPAGDAGFARPVTVDVTGTFTAGTVLRDGYTNRTFTVAADGKVTVDADAKGVILLERDQSVAAPFSWDNATVYFVMTDRFFNGDTANDHSYGRQGDGAQEVGTYHGGDLKGLTQKLDYISALGADAIWITSPLEQMHGWVAGGSGDFKYYAYAGYWTQDFTRLDANMGNADDLRDFIDAAHQRGIRVLFDTVINHPGYASGNDLLEYLPEVLKPGAPTTRDAFIAWQPAQGGTLHDWNQMVDYTSAGWGNWWGGRWVRAGLPGYDAPGSTETTSSLAFLPDFRTEDFRTDPPLPVFLTRKTDTQVTQIAGAKVRDYLVNWHTRWVREFGVDGYRCDTAKHVEPASWAALKESTKTALREWKTANPTKKLDDLDFWMTGENFGATVTRDPKYFDNGFDSLINFDFQPRAAGVISNYTALEALYSSYAASINTDPTFNMLSYISSHDTSLFFADNGGDLTKQAKVGTALLLTPGGVQIYYGDETGRPHGPSASDSKQGTRSDMNWNTYDAGLLAHWQKLGTFRRRHRAVGAGSHQSIPFNGGYAFKRTYDQGGVQDQVVVLLLQP